MDLFVLFLDLSSLHIHALGCLDFFLYYDHNLLHLAKVLLLLFTLNYANDS